MINKMKDEDLLVPLDYSKLEGLENIGPEFLNQSFDPGNKFSIPYFWGTLGIVYNETMVEEAPEHWDDLWKPEYKNSIMLFDGAREVLGLGLNSLGYSLNSKDTQQLEETVDKLYKLTPNIKAIVADEMKGYMIQNNAAIGVTFSGEAKPNAGKKRKSTLCGTNWGQQPLVWQYGYTKNSQKSRRSLCLYQLYVETWKCS